MDTTGLLLAGGQGSRMHGADKGLQIVRGLPLAAHVLARLQRQVDRVIVSANRNLEQYRDFGWPVHADRTRDEGADATQDGAQATVFDGPLAGIRAGLAHCDTPFLACVPCDAPLLPEDLVERLMAALLASGADAAVAVTEEDGARHPQPVFCLLRKTLLPALDNYLRQGGRKMGAWLRSLRLAEAEFADAAAFRNLNTVRELQEFAADAACISHSDIDREKHTSCSNHK